MQTLIMKGPKAILILSALALTACGQREAPSAETSGQDLYEYYCAPCHKITGKGNFLKGVPKLSHTELEITDVLRRLHNPPEGTNMPDFSKLDDATLSRIALYLKDL